MIFGLFNNIKLRSFLKSTGVVSYFLMSNLSTLVFELFKSLCKLSNLSTSIYISIKLAKIVLLAKSNVSTTAAYFKSTFVG